MVVNARLAGALTGQVKLSGRRSLASCWMLKESVPSTGVVTLPNMQFPGDTTVWKFFKQTVKYVLQPVVLQAPPFASRPWVFWNCCISISNTPDPRTWEDTKKMRAISKNKHFTAKTEYLIPEWISSWALQKQRWSKRPSFSLMCVSLKNELVHTKKKNSYSKRRNRNDFKMMRRE